MSGIAKWNGRTWEEVQNPVHGAYALPIVETALEDYTAYDRVDLCQELDRVLGDVIERTMHRYMSKEDAQAERRNKISDFADTIIQRDKAHGNSNSNSA